MMDETNKWLKIVEKSLLNCFISFTSSMQKKGLLTLELFFLPHICLNKDIVKLQEGKFSSIKINSRIMEHKFKEKKTLYIPCQSGKHSVEEHVYSMPISNKVAKLRQTPPKDRM